MSESIWYHRLPIGGPYHISPVDGIGGFHLKRPSTGCPSVLLAEEPCPADVDVQSWRNADLSWETHGRPEIGNLTWKDHYSKELIVSTWGRVIQRMGYYMWELGLGIWNQLWHVTECGIVFSRISHIQITSSAIVASVTPCHICHSQGLFEHFGLFLHFFTLKGYLKAEMGLILSFHNHFREKRLIWPMISPWGGCHTQAPA